MELHSTEGKPLDRMESNEKHELYLCEMFHNDFTVSESHKRRAVKSNVSYITSVKVGNDGYDNNARS